MKIKEFHLNTFSNPYYEFIDEFAQTEYESAKLLGKFYTDYSVSTEMVDRVVQEILKINWKKHLKIIDPFCGDGRLIVELLQALSKQESSKDILFDITIWDVDYEALVAAKESIVSFAESKKMNLTITAEKTDAFVSCFEVLEVFDVCVTNPPWGLLKPLKVFNSRCSEEELAKYKSSIAAYDDYMRQEFLISQPTSKFGKWGTNLGRCGLEVALRLISQTGICGLVSPASLFNDQVSLPFRKWIFDNYEICNISYYPAELKLYGSADVSSITAVIKNGYTEDIHIKLFDLDFDYTECNLQDNMMEYVREHDYLIPLEFGIDALKLQMKWDEFISLDELCYKNKLRFVRELDETRLHEKVCNNGNYIFAKGYMVNKYSFEPDNLYLNEENIDIPKTAKYAKLVWRDVSRNSQKRRVKATILEENCVAGNSLGAIYSEENNKEILKCLLAVINSYVFEFQARKQLVSNHVPVGVLKKVKVPEFSVDSELLALIERRIQGEAVDEYIEICVAKMYQLQLDEFLKIVSTFNEESIVTERLKQLWNNKERIIL